MKIAATMKSIIRQRVILWLATSTITAMAAKIAANTGQKISQNVDETNAINGTGVTM